MRNALILLSQLMVIGCWQNELVENRIRVELRDTLPMTGDLLSVRDDAIIIGERLTDSLMHATLIPISRIDHIYHASAAKTTWMWIGAGVGALIPIITIGTIATKSSGSGGLAVAVVGGPYLLAGMVIGGLLGYFIPSSESAFDPSDADDLREIKRFAKYPVHGEPEELQKLK